MMIVRAVQYTPGREAGQPQASQYLRLAFDFEFKRWMKYTV